MVEIRKAIPEDALGITIVNVYTWKTAYTGLIPDDLIDYSLHISLIITKYQKVLIVNRSINYYEHFIYYLIISY